jgi:hypothetical protein
VTRRKEALEAIRDLEDYKVSVMNETRMEDWNDGRRRRP